MTSKKFEILHREALFQGYYRIDRFHLRQELYKGGWSEVFSREVFFGTRNAAAILLFDPHQDKVIMIEEFRTGPMARGDDPYFTALPAGVVDAGETPEDTARRESLEEAGCTVTDMQKVFSYYPSPGCVVEQVTVFIGKTQAPADGTLAGLAHEGEDIKVIVMDAAQAISMLYESKLRDAHSIVAMQWFALHHTELRSRWLVSEASTMII